MHKLKPNKAKADKLFSLLIRKRGECEYCQTPYNLQCAHIFSRSYYPTRWDSDNAFCLCASHHVYFTHRPIEWEDWVIGKIGADKYYELRVRARTYVKLDYPAITARLESELRGGE